jgi:hypothetical protein
MDCEVRLKTTTTLDFATCQCRKFQQTLQRIDLYNGCEVWVNRLLVQLLCHLDVELGRDSEQEG